MNFHQARRKLEFHKILDRITRFAISEPGRAEIRNLECSSDLAGINRELSLVGEVRDLLEGNLEIPLEGLHDVRMFVKHSAMDGARLTAPELLQIGSTLRVARLARTFASKHCTTESLLWLLVSPLHLHKILEFNIGQAVDESGSVRETASKELKTIRRAIVARHEYLQKRLAQILKSVSEQGFSQEEIITTREGRMVIPVKVEHKGRVHGFIHSASSSGATVFIEPSETLELNNEVADLRFREQRETDRILSDLTRQVGEVHAEILCDLDVLAKLDSLKARAKYSIEVNGTQPDLEETGPVQLRGARHPLLLISHGIDGTVPLDVELGGDYSTLVISGPNAGGKSVALKCVGLMVLMAQSGIHVPARSESRLRLFRDVFVDIGDDQSIENDLSTFSSHLSILRDILESADAHSLVLVDEIGSGTDPAEGSAIATAALESLTSRGALTVATTHQGSLKAFAHETPGVTNGAMEFDPETLRPTYRFRAGIPGSSYALEMARRLNVGHEILSRAKSLLGVTQSRLESLLIELEKTSKEYRHTLDTLHEERRNLEDLKETYEAKLASQRKDLREVRDKAIAEAERIVAEASGLIEQSVRNIRESAADREVIRQVHQDIRVLKSQLMRSPEDEVAEVPEGTIAVGASVRLRSGTEPGRVESIEPASKTAFVVFGQMRARVLLSDLIKVSDEVHQPSRPLFRPEMVTTASLRDIDIRGLTGDEAIPLIDTFLDRAFLSGLHRIDIIHGKGTGALRKKVCRFLQDHPRVKSFRLGEWNEGGSGVTVVELSE